MIRDWKDVGTVVLATALALALIAAATVAVGYGLRIGWELAA